MTRYATRLLLAALALALAVACGAPAKRAESARDGAGAPSAPGGARAEVASNVRRADYAGSAACARCHASIAEKFQRSAMHTMTRDAAAATIHAPFDGRAFHFKDDTVTLETRGGARVIRVDSRTRGRTGYAITRVIGGRVREDFVGAPLGGGPERVMPVSWLIAPARLRYKGYSVMTRERPELAEGVVWSATCIFCHNTSPYLLTLMGPLAGGRTPPYQGTVVDRILPADKRWSYAVTDPDALMDAVSDELRAIGESAPDSPHGDTHRALVGAIDATRDAFRGEHLVEVGIGCEACHGGSREHAENPRVRPSFAPKAPFFRVNDASGGAPTRAESIDRACARCHQVLFTRYPWTWEGGKRDSTRAGGSHISSGEARDFLLGACSAKLQCTACHDPHEAGGGRFRELETPKGNALCTACHASLASRPALAAHTHHDPDGAGAACAACHMPRKNMSLTSRLTRYHRIGSPTEPMKVLLDRPLECALCHADKSVEQITSDMERLWGKRYDRDVLRALYGDLTENVMVATLTRGKPHEQAVALSVLGDTRAGAAAKPETCRLVAQALTNRYPLVREYAKTALGAILGRPCDVDLDAPAARIDAQARKCLEFSQIAPSAAQPPSTDAHGDPPGEGGRLDRSNDGED